MKIELDLLMRDSAGKLLGVDAMVGTWDKAWVRQRNVRVKMDGRGTVGARQVALRQLREITNHARRGVANKHMTETVAQDIRRNARGKVQGAYRPGYREAAGRAGVEVHVLPGYQLRCQAGGMRRHVLFWTRCNIGATKRQAHWWVG